jgi:hypothetical protein
MSYWIKNLITAGLILLLQGSCSTNRNVSADSDKSIDFSQYATFAWAPDSSKGERDGDVMVFDNDIVRNNAKNYVSHALTQRGLLMDVESPDLVLQLVLLNEKKERIITYYSHRYMGYYYYSPFYFPYYYPYSRYYTWYGWGYHDPFLDLEAQTVTRTYPKGTVIINMYDRKLQRLVWTGSAEGDIYDPTFIHFVVHPAIDNILKALPLQPIQPVRKSDKQHKGIVRLTVPGRVFAEFPGK